MKLSARQFAALVGALCLAGVVTPMVVGAANGGPSSHRDLSRSAARSTAAAKKTAPTRVIEVDPKTSKEGKIGPGGTRLVGDGKGPLTVDGKVTATDGKGPLTVDGHVTATVDGTVTATDGSGPLTVDGTVNVANGGGPLSVAGTVKAEPVAPGTPWNQVNDMALTGATPRVVLYTGLGQQKLALTSFTVAAEGSTAGTVRVFVIVYVSDSDAGNCLALTGASFGAAERFVVTVPVGETLNVTYPTPLVLSNYADANIRYCVDVEGSGPPSYVAHISGSGFLT
jgi:hypothetical protein